MSLDYYLRCNDCKKKIWVGNYGCKQSQELVDFLEAHEKHSITYCDEHYLCEKETDEYYEKKLKKEKERINLPIFGEIAEIISKFIPLNGNLAGKCPFHEDELDAMIVDLPNQRFHCSECSAAGNIWGFLKLFMEDKNIELFRPIKKDI